MSTITGTNENDSLTSGMTSDSLDGLAGDDTLIGNEGNDTLNGGNGENTVVYGGAFSDYLMTADSNGGWVITDQELMDGNDGIDWAFGVEKWSFQDANIRTLASPISSDQQVNTYTAGAQAQASVAALADGGYVVTWVSWNQNGDNYDVFAQRYSAGGNPVGIEHRVNTYTAGSQWNPVVTGLAGGGHIIVWASSEQDGDDYGIYAQRYDSEGNAVGIEHRINTSTDGAQSKPTVAALSGGGYVVSWQSAFGSSGTDVHAQIYAHDGSKIGYEYLVNTFLAGDQYKPSQTGLADGGFVVVWTSASQEGPSATSTGVYAQVFSANGSKVDEEKHVNTHIMSSQGDAAVAALLGGGYVVVWNSNGQDSSGYGIYSQRFSSDGSKAGTELRVNTYTSDYQFYPSVSTLSDGGYVVVWVSRSQDGDGDGVYSQRFSADGSVIGEEQRINTHATGNQTDPRVAALPDGGYIVVWESSGQDGSDFGIYSYRNTVGESPYLEITLSAGDTPLASRGATNDSIIGSNGNNVIFAGDGMDSVTGGAGNDSINGGSGADTLNGNTGNDTLDGNSGADSLAGGTDDDTYVVDSAFDVVVELANEGNDTLITAFDATAGNNIENIVLAAGSAATVANGDGLGNAISGNALNNILTGLGGNDTLSGDIGNDTLNGGEGTDALTGGNGDDILQGGAGADTLTGGAGDDYYIVEADAFTDVVIESLNGGIDTLDLSGVSFAIGGGMENLISRASSGQTLSLTGNAHDNVITGIVTSGTANFLQTGMTGNDTLIGGIGNDTLYGNDGNDVLIGSGGTDSMVGGIGDDTYFLASAIATLIDEDVDGGTDIIDVSDISYALNNANIENLRGHGTASQLLLLSGNDGNNVISGVTDSGAPRFSIVGGQGDDTLIGNSASDTLSGGEGQDFLSGGDQDDYLSGGNESDTLEGGSGADTLAGGAGDDTYFVGTDVGEVVSEAAEEGLDAIHSNGISWSLGANVENLYGHGSNFQMLMLQGNAGHNRIEGIIDAGTAQFSIQGGEGNDSLFGNAANDTLDGGSGNDLLDGGAGTDRMVGGTGDDQYVIRDTGDTVVESVGAGNDTVVVTGTSWTLNVANIENIIARAADGQTSSIVGDSTANTITSIIDNGLANFSLSGAGGNDTLIGAAGHDSLTGDAGDDSLQGGDGNDDLAGGTGLDTLHGGVGNDTLRGGTEADSLYGGTGDDFYVAGAGVVLELSGEGTDTIAVNYAYTLAENIENIQLLNGVAIAKATGNSSANKITGNEFTNSLKGLDGNDTLDGGLGADTVYGGSGNDRYYVDNSSDKTQELATQGNDTVIALVSWTLGKNFEELTLAGSNNINGNGSLQNNLITGNDGANRLRGLAGQDTLLGGNGNDTLSGGFAHDTLTGGAGIDRFLFDTHTNVATNLDHITDFVSGTDRIQLEDLVFTGLTVGILSANAFVAGNRALDADDRLMYDAATGVLYYDADGTGIEGKTQVAMLDNKAVLTATDIQIV